MLVLFFTGAGPVSPHLDDIHDLEQLERLHELQQQGLIHVHTGELTQAEYDKYNNKLLNRLAHLHLSS